jgi:hypothetical protein
MRKIYSRKPSSTPNVQCFEKWSDVPVIAPENNKMQTMEENRIPEWMVTDVYQENYILVVLHLPKSQRLSFSAVDPRWARPETKVILLRLYCKNGGRSVASAGIIKKLSRALVFSPRWQRLPNTARLNSLLAHCHHVSSRERHPPVSTDPAKCFLKGPNACPAGIISLWFALRRHC